MRLPQRSFLGLLLAVGVATCSEFHPNPLEPSPGMGQLSFAPRFSPEAAAVYARRAQFAAVNFDHVRIVLVRPPEETVKDTTVEFSPTSAPKTLELTVEVRSAGEKFNVSVDYLSTGVAMFHGQAPLPSHPPGVVPPQQPEIVLQYVGPGATATRVVVAPKTANLVAPGGTTFTATAFDANNAVVPNVPVVWTTSDATVAAVDANTGVVATTSKRGTATITASTPTDASDNATLTVSLPPTGLSLVSGGGQTGKAGTALAQPAVVRVTASDGGGVAGVTVNFAPPTGGSVGATSVTTDAQGQASTTMTLGPALGPQSFAAAAADFSVSIPATATAGDAGSIVVVSGSGQQDTVRRALAAPFVVKVTDSFGNAVSGATVSWTRTAGSGTLGAATSTTNANGQASMTYTLGATPGQETISASAAGVATPATFTATAVAAGPDVIAIVSGNNQTGPVGQPLPAPLVVKVTDAGGFPAVGVAVNWSATNGTIAQSTTTDAQGQTSASLTVGPAVGQATAVASIPTGTTRSVTFSATVQPGPVAKLVIGTQPTTTAAQTPIKPAVTVELRDAAGNLTPSTNSVTIALGANPGQATLTGTLTRAAVGGVATFDDLRISNAAKGYTLVASSAGVPSVTSVAFDVFNPLTLQFFGTQPTTATSGLPLNPPPGVRVFDVTGKPVAGQPVTVTASSGTLSGTTVVMSNADGVAVFSNLTLTGSGRIILTFSAPGATPLTEPIDVSQGSIVFIDAKGTPIIPPPSAVTMIAGQLPDNLRGIRVQDATGAGIPSVSVHFSVSSAGTKLLEGDALTDATGAVSLTSLGFDPKAINQAGVYDLGISALGFNQLALQVTVQPGAPVRFVMTAETLRPAPNTPDPIIGQLVDAFGNAVPKSVPVSWDWTGPGQLVERSTTTDATGKATGSFVIPAGVAGPSTIFLTASGVTPTASIQLNPPAGLDLSLGSSRSPTRQNGNELKHGSSGETRIGAEARQRD